MDGIAAVKRKDYESAEPLLMAAFQAMPPGDMGRWTACCYLGMAYRHTARFEEAVNVLEKALPLPGAFTELASIYRFLAKAAKKEGDAAGQAECYRKMFCLSILNEMALSFRVANGTNGIDWHRGAKWIADLRTEHGTIYPYQYDGRDAPADSLLTQADYRALKACITAA